MKKLALLCLVLLVSGLFFSCATITTPVSATSNTMGSKVGVAEGSTFLGFFGSDTGTSIQAAAANGGITEISSVDFSYNPGILGIVQKYTCTVTGE
ncbi:MAG: TRL domain-containing protein [Spirochaetales bacterium]|nr:TRL domain-containing protein [Spirochaetales bacterium]